MRPWTLSSAFALALVSVGAAAQLPTPANLFPFDLNRLEAPVNGPLGAPSAFCLAMANDLRSGGDVRFLKPTATFATLDDLEKHSPFGTCSLEYIVQDVFFTAEQYALVKDLPFEKRWLGGVRSIRTERFALFESNFDGDASNGKELLLYGAGSRYSYGTWPERDTGPLVGSTWFVIPDLKTCQARISVQVSDPAYHSDAVAGVVEYRGDSLIYDARYSPTERLYSLVLSHYDGINKVSEPACSFRVKDE